MKTANLLFSAIEFLFVLLILLLGGFLIGLYYAPHLRFAIAQFFIEHNESLIPIGLCVLGCGLLLLIGFYSMNRAAYFRFSVPFKPKCTPSSESQKSPPSPAQTSSLLIESALIQKYIKIFWDEQFPHHHLKTEVILHSNETIEISLEMPPLLQNSDDRSFLEKIERDLSDLLTNTLGYQRDFFLTLFIP